MPDITLTQAKTVVEAALAKAQELGVKMKLHSPFPRTSRKARYWSCS